MKKAFLFFTSFLILLVYSFSLNREWQFFDERMLYNEGLFPIPTTPGEILEVISTYALSNHFDSQNAFFSNIITIRSSFLGSVLSIIVSFFFKKNVLYYHVLQISIHILNSALIWLIFSSLFESQKISLKNNSIFSSLITLVWALHPANVEAVLLATNWLSLLSHSFLLGLFLYFIKRILSDGKSSIGQQWAVVFLYFISTLITEYSYTLLPILFSVSVAFNYKKSSVLKNIKPFFVGSVFSILFSLYKHLAFQSHPYTSFNISFERIFWLAPQIFVHFLKLFFYPKDLSLYQTNLLNLSDSLISPHIIFSLLLFLSFLLVPIFWICINPKNEKSYVPFLVYGFIFSLLPFLQIVTPTYCLFAERYCYFPLFIFLFMISNLARRGVACYASTPSTLIIMIFIVCLLGTRTYTRILDWKDSFSLYSSALKCSNDNLYKGQIHSVLGYYFEQTNKKEKMKRYLNLSINELKNAIKKLEHKKTRLLSYPETLKTYGLDPVSKLITLAFSISSTKLNNFKESPSEVLKFYEPYIKDNLERAGSSQIDLYAKLLLETKNEKKALEVLEHGKKTYPLSPLIIYSLSDFYLYNAKDLIKAEQILKEAFHYYPSYKRILIRMVKLSELKNDPLSLAKYEYLVGLRTHSLEAYQKSLQIYLQLNKLKETKKILDKLLGLDKKNPATLLLLSKYYYLSGYKDKVIETLNEAYASIKSRGINLNIPIYKSILLSLISFNAGNHESESTKKYIMELESLSTLSKEEKLFIENIKKEI